MQAGRINVGEITGLGGKAVESLRRSELERYRCIQRVNAGRCDYGKCAGGGDGGRSECARLGKLPGEEVKETRSQGGGLPTAVVLTFWLYQRPQRGY